MGAWSALVDQPIRGVSWRINRTIEEKARGDAERAAHDSRRRRNLVPPLSPAPSKSPPAYGCVPGSTISAGRGADGPRGARRPRYPVGGGSHPTEYLDRPTEIARNGSYGGQIFLEISSYKGQRF